MAEAWRAEEQFQLLVDNNYAKVVALNLKFPGWKMAGTPGTCMEVEKEGR